MIWVVLGLMTVLAAGAVLLPYWRGRTAPASRAAYDLEIYRDQLAEVERDQKRGLIGADEAQAARLEIARRALAADAAAKVDAPPPAARGHTPRLVMIAAGAAPLLALLIYLGLGSPTLPSHVFVAQQQPAGHSGQDAELVAQLETRMKDHPDDVQGWILLARSYRTMGRTADASRAWREVIERAPNPGEYAGLYAEALVAAADGMVTPEAQSRFQQALAADPLDPRARYYLGLAKAQAGESRAALQAWVDLIAISPPDAPWLPVVHEGISHIAAEAKIDLASIKPSPDVQRLAREAQVSSPPASAERSASAGPVPPQSGMPPGAAAIQSLPPNQQAAAIHNMVDQLASRLDSNPNDVDGWLRLGHARHVLGEEDKSIEAYAKAAALAPNRPDVQNAYKEALANGKAEPQTPTTSAPPPAATPQSGMPPNAAAIQAMPPEQRTAMIHSMVDQLASRLESNPNDVDGWLRLGRARHVLGEEDKSADAYARADALAPDRLDAQTAYAEALANRLVPGERPPEDYIKLMRHILDLDPNDGDALWTVGMAEAEAGHHAAAIALWQRLITQLPPESKERGQIQSQIDELKKER
ncbi:MAG: c-type cytochrome biogenesis protein CcmI [Alphaproteobacteria bacterium]|nr:c-type cytochrome biogenesis protein CcmI [Alphaproteobacteria bacterium]